MGIFEHMNHWTTVNRFAKFDKEFEVIARESHCRQAVMWWVHLLQGEKRDTLRKREITVPLLPATGEKKNCEGSEVCNVLAGTSTCDWCHSKQSDRDAKIPGTSAPSADDLPAGPDDGNPKGWDRKRRCDQNYEDENGVRGCPPCEVVAHAKSEKFLLPKPVHPVYPKKFTVTSDRSGGFGEMDTLIGWQKPTDTACLAFFPQNDSSSFPLCYRHQSANLKVYDIENERGYFEYKIGPNVVLNLTNTTTHILHNDWQMWVMNWIPFDAAAPTPQCVCTNPSGQHCTDPPCYSYIFNYNTFEDAAFVGPIQELATLSVPGNHSMDCRCTTQTVGRKALKTKRYLNPHQPCAKDLQLARMRPSGESIVMTMATSMALHLRQKASVTRSQSNGNRWLRRTS